MLDNRSNGRSDENLFQNLRWPIVWTIIATASGAGSLLTLTRGMPVAEFSDLAFTQLLFGLLLYAASEAGRPTIIARAVDCSTGQLETIIYYWLLVLASVFFLSVCTCIFLWSHSNNVQRSLLLIFSVGVLASGLNCSLFLDVERRQHLATGIRAAGETAALITFLSLALTESLSATKAAIVFLGKWSFETAFTVGFVYWPGRHLRLDCTVTDFSKLARSWIRITLGAVLSVVPLHGGIYFLRYWSNSQEVAIQGVVQQAAMGVAVAGALLVRFLQPTVNSKNSRNLGHFRYVFVCYGVLSFLIWAVSVCALRVISSKFLPSAYASCVIPFALQTAAWLASFNAVLATSFLLRSSQETFVLFANTVTLLLFLLASPFAASRYGSLGACCVSAAAAMASSLILTGRVWGQTIKNSPQTV